MFRFYGFFTYYSIIVHTPGINNLLSMSNVVWLGFRRGTRFNFGILTGFTAVMSVRTVFSVALYSFLPKVKIVMQLLGTAYMLYLAWEISQSSVGLNAGSQKEASFPSGMILQFVSPKTYVCTITAMFLYTLPVCYPTGALIGFTMLLSLIGASDSSVWALFGAALYKSFSKHTKPVSTVMVLLLVYYAVSLFPS